MNQHSLADLLPDYGDRDFLCGVLADYVLNNVQKHLAEQTNSNWFFEHAEYANSVLGKIGGNVHDIEPFKNKRGIFKEK